MTRRCPDDLAGSLGASNTIGPDSEVEQLGPAGWGGASNGSGPGNEIRAKRQLPYRVPGSRERSFRPRLCAWMDFPHRTPVGRTKLVALFSEPRIVQPSHPAGQAWHGADRGVHVLKGVPGEWRLFAVVQPR